MKTIPILRSAFTREVVAWIVLSFSILFFGATLAFSQEPDAKKTNGKMTIKIEKEENGNKLSIDTTFDLKDFDKVQEYVRSLDPEIGLDDKAGEGRNHDMNFHFRNAPFEKMEMGEFRNEMGKMKEELRNMEKQLKEMNIEIFSDSFISMHPFRYHMDDPGEFDFDLDFDFDMDHEGKKIIIHKRHGGDLRSDTIKCSEKVIILGDDPDDDSGTRNVQKIIIYKNKGKKDSGKEEKGDKRVERKMKEKELKPMHFEFYPNPGDGKFTLSFNFDKKEDTDIKIFDQAGKEIYSETLNDFSGEYKKELDISGKGKGAFILKLSRDGKKFSKKIIVE